MNVNDEFEIINMDHYQNKLTKHNNEGFLSYFFFYLTEKKTENVYMP